MQLKLALFNEVLRILAKNYTKSYTLEELTNIVVPVYNYSSRISDNIVVQRENQAKVLDTLILLEIQDFITLNALTDECSIKIKGLIKIKVNDCIN